MRASVLLSFRGARSANPESRGSGSGPSNHPGTTTLLESPRRLLDLLLREEDLLGVGDDVLGLPAREGRRPAFHFHHPHFADATGAGDAEHLAGLVARQFGDHV